MLAVSAHAKVNLALEITGRRPDGYHDLVTVIATLDWHDLVCVEVCEGAGRTAVSVAGPTADPQMADAGSLVGRAAAALHDLSGRRFDIVVAIEKRLPVAAGMGGGSADGAAVLRAGAAEIGRLGVPISQGAASRAAEALGSDVPAVLHGGTAVARGRGELLIPLPGAPVLHLAVAVAGASSTPAVYAALTDDERRADGRAERVAGRLASGLAPQPDDCGSALEPAALRVDPRLAGALERLRSMTARRWHLTGTGGAAFHIAPSYAGAEAASAEARALGYPARACRTLTLPFVAPIQSGQ
jgi:4-diphosphocytidyl-2-C-methyl-D-erythritol kinase